MPPACSATAGPPKTVQARLAYKPGSDIEYTLRPGVQCHCWVCGATGVTALLKSTANGGDGVHEGSRRMTRLATGTGMDNEACYGHYNGACSLPTCIGCGCTIVCCVLCSVQHQKDLRHRTALMNTLTHHDVLQLSARIGMQDHARCGPCGLYSTEQMMQGSAVHSDHVTCHVCQWQASASQRCLPQQELQGELLAGGHTDPPLLLPEQPALLHHPSPP